MKIDNRNDLTQQQVQEKRSVSILLSSQVVVVAQVLCVDFKEKSEVLRGFQREI
jgi:hypothetical protein